ncbi:SusC/RagA family TonB-linked outer membrane protein [Pedobacter hiemivivus]|nr:SusC/RagA family TonB-linked outer membrane protein [Pedobacter hiemivivus]
MKRDVLQKYIHKILLIMRLTIIIILIAVIQLSAKDTRGQKLTYNKKDITLFDLFMEIGKQTGYRFVWSDSQFHSRELIDADFYNTPIEKVMDKLLFGRSVTYQIVGKSIVIKVDNRSLIEKGIGVVVGIDVRGRVMDENNQPLQGATVKIKGSTNSTVTNANGEFSLQNVNANDILVISYIGYDSKEINASERLGNIRLVLSTDKLEEVEINAGYYTVTDRKRTGSISSVDSKVIADQPISNPLQALQGRIPGVQIQQTSGFSGARFNIIIRGLNSLRPNGNAPLYIINGVPFISTSIASGLVSSIIGIDPLSAFNPDDIESIEILKDADATAIYGSRGANGVVLITTKFGKARQTTFDINIYKGMAEVPKFMEVLNTEEYLEMRKEAFVNDKKTAAAVSDYDMNGAWDQNRYTDWQEKLIGGTAQTHDIQLGISGGNDQTSFLIKAGQHRESTVLPVDNVADNKYSLLLNLNHNSSNRKFKANMSLSYLKDENDLVAYDPTTQAVTLSPNAPEVFDEKGKINWQNGTWRNPFANFESRYFTENRNIIINSELSYAIIKGLNLKTSLGYTQIDLAERNTLPSTYYNPTTGPVNGSAMFSKSNLETWIIEPQLSFEKKLGDGHLTILVGSTFQKNNFAGETLSASGYTNDSMLGVIKGAATIAVSSATQSLYKYNALFGRINYDWKDKYILNVTGRRDGSSRFGPGKQFANFGAIGAAWIFSQENFIKKNIPFLSFGKLRSSYGITGSDQIGDYGYYDLWSSTLYNYGTTTGLAPVNLFNPDFAWEENQKFEIELSLGFLRDRINTSFSYYRNRSGNQLVGFPVPSTTGFNIIQSNLNAIVQNTGLEVVVSSRNVDSKYFKWTSSFNISIPRTKLVSFPGIENTSYRNSREVGKSLNIVRSYKFTELNTTTGIYKFEDRNGDGIQNPLSDYQSLVEKSQSFFGGFQNIITYKNWDFTFLIQFVKQTGDSYRNYFVAPGFLGNQPIQILNRWQKEGDTKPVQRFTQTTSTAYIAYQNSLNSTLKVTDASFVRLKNLAISYNLPGKLMNKIKCQKAKVYVQGQNLGTITNYVGLDPETQSLSLPPLRTITLGFQLTI